MVVAAIRNASGAWPTARVPRGQHGIGGDEGGALHGGVVHAGDRHAHDGARRDALQHARHVEGEPQRDDGGADRNRDG